MQSLAPRWPGALLPPHIEFEQGGNILRDYEGAGGLRFPKPGQPLPRFQDRHGRFVALRPALRIGPNGRFRGLPGQTLSVGEPRRLSAIRVTRVVSIRTIGTELAGTNRWVRLAGALEADEQSPAGGQTSRQETSSESCAVH